MIPARARILIADDDRMLRRLVRATLPPGEFHIEEASDGPATIERTRAREFDVVLLDWHMPGVSGAELLSSIKSANPSVRIVVLTADHNAAERMRASSIAADAFLTKPFSPIELLRILGWKG